MPQEGDVSMKPSPPEGLADPGRDLWVRIVEKYDLRQDELATLEDACAATDMIAALSEAWESQGRPLTTKGSMGQQIIHPLIGEIRTQRSARNALWRQLKLPDDGGAVESNQHRAAAQSKWAQAHGKGA